MLHLSIQIQFIAVFELRQEATANFSNHLIHILGRRNMPVGYGHQIRDGYLSGMDVRDVLLVQHLRDQAAKTLYCVGAGGNVGIHVFGIHRQRVQPCFVLSFKFGGGGLKPGFPVIRG